MRSRTFLFTKSLIVALAIFDGAHSFQSSSLPNHKQSIHQRSTSSRQQPHSSPSSALHIFKTDKEAEVEQSPSSAAPSTPTAEETTEKYGLEAGLFQSLKSSDGDTAKSLLAKYGVAYLATSIPLAIVSFTLCYLLVDNGVDVGSLLSKVGIEAGDSGEKAGTFAIAYAAHKAASPIRFPPTVLLTPVVAKLIGKEPNEVDAEGESD
ncbi:predicted protein [Thalassiosira pseudonana CCMP1335]|uniref:DUF1279 domain-containing protein n=1 Tax=Thalassiosira pseudonana TaxID=35128 RepID=B8BRH8_THAPS|nr:predicted protein [Thalassiosira pseudonana CCMP1335]EED95958.1 predicted protein [Thalassiosira pseudonana CCMP1335]